MRLPAHMVWLRVFAELNGLDILSPLLSGLRDSMHAVHDSSACRQNDRKGQIRLFNESHVLEQGTPRWRVVISVPGLVELADLPESDALPKQVGGKSYQAVHIPC